MLNENAKEWVKKLRSGEFQQGRDLLNRNGKFCCLGVACEVAREKGVNLNITVGQSGEIEYDKRGIQLPPKVQEWLGLNSEIGKYKGEIFSSLMTLNDVEYYTFEQIADLIESEPEGLFA
jgi:hypothetical protein